MKLGKPHAAPPQAPRDVLRAKPQFRGGGFRCRTPTLGADGWFRCTAIARGRVDALRANKPRRSQSKRAVVSETEDPPATEVPERSEATLPLAIEGKGREERAGLGFRAPQANRRRLMAPTGVC